MILRSAILAVFCTALAAQDASQDFPAAKQAALGAELARQVRRHTTPVESQTIHDYVSRLGSAVAAGLPQSAFPLSFFVVDELQTPLHEPLVLPGGNVFVPLSLLKAANQESELAAVLADTLARGPFLIRIGSGPIPLYFTAGANPLIRPGALGQWRAAQLQADQPALAAISSAGFDPEALLRYIEREQTGDAPFTQLPPRAERIAELDTSIAGLPARAQYIEDSSDFVAVRALARTAGSPRPRPSLLSARRN